MPLTLAMVVATAKSSNNKNNKRVTKDGGVAVGVCCGVEGGTNDIIGNVKNVSLNKMSEMTCG